VIDGPAALLHLPEAGRSLPVAAGHTLLEAALAAGVPLARSCRNGSCRACLARLAAGQVTYRIEWPGLLAEEKAAGWVLPCVALAASAELTLVDVQLRP
jgi:ferredoxin